MPGTTTDSTPDSATRSRTATAWIGLGANLGDAQGTVRSAIAAINQLPLCAPQRCSSLYLSAPVDAQGDHYVNAVMTLRTDLAPLELLNALQQIERDFGRTRPHLNAPRTLDCDVLLFDQQMINLPTLTVSHPRMHQRAFVLVPLTELAPDILIPGHGLARDLLPGVADQVIRKLA